MVMPRRNFERLIADVIWMWKKSSFVFFFCFQNTLLEIFASIETLSGDVVSGCDEHMLGCLSAVGFPRETARITFREGK